MKKYTCEGCGKSVEDPELEGPPQQYEVLPVITTAYPDHHLDGLVNFWYKLYEERDTPVEEKKYHIRYVWTRGYGCACCGGNQPTLCGPLKEQSSQEDYVSWIS